MSETITIHKLNLAGETTWSYSGHVRQRTPTHLQVEAFFNRDRVDLGYVVFERGDRFIEDFFTDRWYNIFEVHAAADDRLKGWYCNVVKPAVFHADTLEQVDLALDLWISPDGPYVVLDEHEFAQLELDSTTRHHARRAVNELIYLLYHRAAPFEGIQRPQAISFS